MQTPLAAIFALPFFYIFKNSLLDLTVNNASLIGKSIIRGEVNLIKGSRTTHLLHNSLKAPLQRAYKVWGDSNKVILYSTNLTSYINPLFITGFVDAEGSFILKITKSYKYKAGWKVEPVFSIGLHSKDLRILEQIQNYWGGTIGRINRTGDAVNFTVSGRKDLAIILDHFCKYPLITQKKADFELFKLAVETLNQREYLESLSVIQSIVNIRASLNLGLSDILKEHFPETIPADRPLITNQKIPHPEWIAGFTSGDGCFSVKIRKGSTKIGYRVELAFILIQHTRDQELMQSLISYLDCGNFYKQTNKDICRFVCEDVESILNNIIPFFKKHNIIGVKASDFQDWCRVADIIKSKNHLTTQGLSLIKEIKDGMNKSRIED